MDISIQETVVHFIHEGRIVGEYVLDDRFKPHFRSLKTPSGHETTLVSPGDHRHHKGLMYGLRCGDLNFWEETPGRQCGIQSILKTGPAPDRDGIQQDLLWRDDQGGLETYREQRQILARHDAAKSAIVYRWRTCRESLRDHTLVKSPWSLELPDGRKINYHGLGIRLPWMWRFPGGRFCGVEADGAPVDPLDACGTSGPSIGFWGQVDGQWERTVASVTIRQEAGQGFCWFVLKGDFPYLALGPSNAEGFAVKAGQLFRETYHVEVADRDPGLAES